jgi:hypothetical protein
LVIAPLILAGTIAAGSAATIGPTVLEGLAACQEKCDSMGPESRSKCRQACEAYWYCNGSDASYGLYVEICNRIKSQPPSGVVTSTQTPRQTSQPPQGTARPASSGSAGTP